MGTSRKRSRKGGGENDRRILCFENRIMKHAKII
jgi:hypothetical protein